MIEVARALVHREARLLDERRWADWLALYRPDATFWMPAWDAEFVLTADPDREVSLIYYASRAGLEDRVWRIESGKSVASMPLARTTHLIAGVELLDQASDRLRVASAWTTHVWRTKTKQAVTFFGRYEHELARADDGWRIRRKKIVLVNDTVPTMLDFYCV